MMIIIGPRLLVGSLSDKPITHTSLTTATGAGGWLRHHAEVNKLGHRRERRLAQISFTQAAERRPDLK